jgi:hypothetical protein
LNIYHRKPRLAETYAFDTCSGRCERINKSYGPAFSQAPGNGSTAAKQTFREKAAERRNAIENRKRAKQEQLKEAEERDIAAMKVRKRTKDACSKQAKAKKLHLLKRQRFMKKCMAG